MRKLIVIVGMFAALLTACGRAPTVERVTPTAAEAPTVIVVEMPTATPASAYPGPGAYPEPGSGQATPEATSAINEATMRAMGELARQKLAEELAISADQIIIVGADPVYWSDASLGCPQPDTMYPQVITPGYRVSLAHDGKVYTYHTDTTQMVVRCDQR